MAAVKASRNSRSVMSGSRPSAVSWFEEAAPRRSTCRDNSSLCEKNPLKNRFHRREASSIPPAASAMSAANSTNSWRLRSIVTPSRPVASSSSRVAVTRRVYVSTSGSPARAMSSTKSTTCVSDEPSPSRDAPSRMSTLAASMRRAPSMSASASPRQRSATSVATPPMTVSIVLMMPSAAMRVAARSAVASSHVRPMTSTKIFVALTLPFLSYSVTVRIAASIISGASVFSDCAARTITSLMELNRSDAACRASSPGSTEVVRHWRPRNSER